LDLEYCNGQKRYDFHTDEGFYFHGCEPKHYHIKDVGPKAFRRGYVAALFTENNRWLTAIEKYQMLVPGTRKNPKAAARDLAAKNYLLEQVSPDTYEDRKAFYEAWKDTPCCADDCWDFCDKCSNKGIKFQRTPTFGLDADVRRYITRYGRYQTTSELKEAEDARNKESTGAVLSGICDGKSNNHPAGNREQKGDELFSESEIFPSDQSEGVQKMLSSPFGENLVT
jgi:hypothetical protein